MRLCELLDLHLPWTGEKIQSSLQLCRFLPAPLNLPLIRGQAGAAIPAEAPREGSAFPHARSLHPHFLGADPAALPRICSSPRRFSAPVAHPGVRKCQKPSEGNRGSRRDLGCPSSLSRPPPIPAFSIHRAPNPRGPRAALAIAGFNSRFRNRNKPWAGRERLERRRSQANKDCWPGFGLLLVRKTGILECNIKIPSFQASFGAEEGFNPQLYAQTVSKIHFLPLFPCAELSPQPPKSSTKKDFLIFSLCSIFQATLPCCRSRHVFPERVLPQVVPGIYGTNTSKLFYKEC